MPIWFDVLLLCFVCYMCYNYFIVEKNKVVGGIFALAVLFGTLSVSVKTLQLLGMVG